MRKKLFPAAGWRLCASRQLGAFAAHSRLRTHAICTLFAPRVFTVTCASLARWDGKAVCARIAPLALLPVSGHRGASSVGIRLSTCLPISLRAITYLLRISSRTRIGADAASGAAWRSALAL